jgi:hypothetical protein
MPGYSEGSLGPFIAVNYNAYVGASMQGYSKISVGPFISLYYIF